jgi:Tol biopolymer transport system component
VFWSPDSRRLAFFDSKGLNIIEADGGVARLLASTGVNAPGSWNREGTLLFASLGNNGIGLMRVSVDGGEPQQLGMQQARPAQVSSTASGSGFGNWISGIEPQFLPDQRHFLYSVASGSNANDIYVGDLSSGSSTRLPSPTGIESRIRYAGPGYLLYLRHGALLAQPFDANRLVISGDPIPVEQGVGAFAASDSGVLVFLKASDSQSSRPRGAVTWFDRKGGSSSAGESVGVLANLSLSPVDDEQAVFMAPGSSDPNATNIWTIDLSRGVPTPVTNESQGDLFPIWSPDGTRIAYTALVRRSSADGSPHSGVFIKAATGTGMPEQVLEADTGFAVSQDWFRDLIVFCRFPGPPTPSATSEIWALPLTGDRKAFRVVSDSRCRAKVSPDGHWLAYTVNRSGKEQIVVQPFPVTTASSVNWTVTKDGGVEPRWSRDGRELFYLAPDRTLMVATVIRTADGLKTGVPAPVVRNISLAGGPGPSAYRYDVRKDGQRFLFNTSTPDPDPAGQAPAIRAILNWTSLLTASTRN